MPISCRSPLKVKGFMDVLQESTVRKVFLGPEGSKRPEFLEKCSYLWTLLGSRWISQ